MELKSKCLVFLIVICIIFSITAVSASENQSDVGLSQDLVSDNQLGVVNDDLDEKLMETANKSYDDFYDDIRDCNDTFNIESNYVYDESSNKTLTFNQTNLVINGNNHIIDGSNNAGGFVFTNNKVNVTINDLTFINCNKVVWLYSGNLTLNNVNFTSNFNSRDSDGLISVLSGGNLILNNCNFNSNINSSLMNLNYGEVAIYNSHFYNTHCGINAPIFVNRKQLIIENCTFENLSSKYGGAIHFRGDTLSVKNSTFKNTHAYMTGGAILARYFEIVVYDDQGNSAIRPSEDWIIDNCEFLNVSSSHDGGAIYTHSNTGKAEIPPKVIHISNCNFTDSASGFGGAIGHLDGALDISNTNFINSRADNIGGAIYTSWANLTLTNCNVINSSAGSNAGAIYFDKGKLVIDKSNFTDNKVNAVSLGNESVIYANDVDADIKNSTFKNGGIAIYANFAGNSNIQDIDSTDLFLMNNTDYIVSVENKGIRLNLTNNSIVIDKLPSRFDLRDWGWASPLKFQENSMACWAFASIAALECSLLKATGVLYNLSEENLYNLELKYYSQGDARATDIGFAYSGLGYALSWRGPVPAQEDPFDERGMFSDVVQIENRIHLQDAMIILAGRNDTADLIKQAIIKYGSVTVQYNPMPYDYNVTNYTDEGLQPGHFVPLIGWDDNYPAENFIGSPGVEGNPPKSNGAWLIKDSESENLSETEGTFMGRGGYIWISYEDPSFLAKDLRAIIPQAAGVAYIFENTIDYHVNYQTDLTGLAGFDGNYTYYSNEFTSKYSELIGAVGTYFNQSGIDYSFDIYVNGEKVHSQTGVSEFAGFRTIVLNSYVPVKAGDKFKVVFKNNALPFQAFSRQHYVAGMSMVSADGESWSDITLVNRTVCLKVYTLEVDQSSFTALGEAINQSGKELNITHDYKFNESIDSTLLLLDEMFQIQINKTNLVINGNGHVIDGAGMGATFYFVNPVGELIINNLTFKNFNLTVLRFEGNATLNNVNFTSNFNSNAEYGIVTSEAMQKFILNNCNFDSNINSSLIMADFSNVEIYNSHFYNTNSGINSPIYVNRKGLVIENCTFENLSGKYGGAINFRGDTLSVKNSTFKNTSAMTGGAILARYFAIENGSSFFPSEDWLIYNCEFLNVSSSHNGGAIYTHSNPAYDMLSTKVIHISNCNFTDTASGFGGAIGHLDGALDISNTNFINSKANVFGGAIYTSWANLTLTNCNVINSSAGSNAGAIYFDKGKLVIDKSNFTDNKVNVVSSGNESVIYANDVDADIKNSTFKNGGIAIYANFAGNSNIQDIDSTDLFLMNNTDYIVSVENKGIRLNLTNNSIVIDKLPSRFDLRDWGWASPLKFQENSMACWAFASIAALECSLLKATGVLYNLSEDNLYNLELKYYSQGDARATDVGFAYSGLGYALSWRGPVPAQEDPFDERGMFSDVAPIEYRIHLQDAMIIFGGRNDTADLIKQAIIKYGAVSIQYSVAPFDYNVTSYTDDDLQPGHFVTVIGWDDNFPVEKFIESMAVYKNPPKSNGAWLIKDSESANLSETEGLVMGEGGYIWISYENPSFLAKDLRAIIPQAAGVSYIFENTIDYHVNYQTDLTGLSGFDGNYTYYSNEFTSKYSELIGAVGTYFNQSGIDYSFDIYVNGEKVHSQTGVSEFAGFRTIVLNSYVPVKAGDKFKVVFKNNALPFQAFSRQHYVAGMSMVSADGESWSDITLVNRTVCLKVYTVKDDTKIVENKDIAVDYDGGSYFTVKVTTADGHTVGAGLEVKFTINGKTTTVKTDSNGIAKIKITQLPGKYAITTAYKGESVKNTVTVKQVLTASKVTVKKTAKNLVLKATLKINGKPVSGKAIKFTLNGKTYTAKTNKKGVAQVKIGKKALLKLKNAKKYTVKVTYLKDTIKTTVKAYDVIVLKAKKISVKKTAKKLKLKATLKLNGKAAKGKKITFKLNGKKYKAKTNKKGIAQKTLKKKVIKKLKKGKNYKVKVTYGKKTIKTTVKVKR